MMPTDGLPVRNGQTVEIDWIPKLSIDEFRKAVVEAVHGGARISAFFGVPESRLSGKKTKSDQSVRLFCLLAMEEEGMLFLLSTEVMSAYPSLTPDCDQAHLFEREIYEQCGVLPEGHPWLKPVRLTENPEEGFFEMQGAETHQVAVGPVHAGIIEPGHFRFQCHGENVYHLEIALGYQHRGVERAMTSRPVQRQLHYAETLAGDTTIGHANAFTQALESLAGCTIPPRALALRGIALELERLANHAGDLGALSGDVGFLPTASYCGRIRGDFLNMTALICGNRFGRGLVIPGGAGFGLDERLAESLVQKLNLAEKDVTSAVDLLWNTSSVMARFENTGILSEQTCLDLGLVGPAARACGVKRDVRRDFPTGLYRFAHIPVSVWDSGDVFGRAFVRWLEIQRSIAFIRDQAEALPSGEITVPIGCLAKRSFTVSLIEGWRGEICHVALTDDSGDLVHYKVDDPSFHNWFGLAVAMRGQPISDFPLCNKSFNLSYCGHDL